jgi:hypothetical protein
MSERVPRLKAWRARWWFWRTRRRVRRLEQDLDLIDATKAAMRMFRPVEEGERSET